MNKIFSTKHILFDVNVSNQKAAFTAIAKLAQELKITNNADDLVNDLLAREKISTTGMMDQIAIPHAMSADFNEPAIIVARFKKGVEWNSIGGKPVKIAFALLIPEKLRGSLHMTYLQNISTALLDEKFVKTILNTTKVTELFNVINKAIMYKEESAAPASTNDAKGLIVGISACATGVAHTYMARESLEKHGKDVGYDVWIETQGQSGQEHRLNAKQIAEAKAVVIASDIHVDLDRFNGKTIYTTDTNEAINTPKEVLTKAIESKKIYQGKDSGTKSSNADTFGNDEARGFMKHFLSGVSHMIPFIVFSGIVYAILNAICVIVYKNGPIPPKSIMQHCLDAANVGFLLFTGVMGGYIANSIAGRAALGPGFIATFVAATPSMYIFYGMHPNATIGNNPPIHDISLGIVAAIMMGFAAGHLVNLFNRIHMYKTIKPILPLIIIPVCATSLLVFPFLFALSGIMGIAMNWFGAALAYVGMLSWGRILIGFVLGAMVGFDMGGPINKIAVATATSLIQVDPRLMGGVAAAIPIAPLGCGFASVVLGRKVFSEEERGLGISALALGFMGISEGAIPFASRRLKQTFIANVVGSAIAGGLSCLFCVGGHVGMWGGLIIAFTMGIYSPVGTPAPFSIGGGGASFPNALVTILWYFLAIAIGMIIHAMIYVTLVRTSQGGSLSSNLKEMFKRDKNKTPEIAPKKEDKPRKFEHWYRNNLIQDNWYYRAKVLNKKSISW